MAGPAITVKLLADASGFQKGVGEAESAAGGMRSTMGKVAGMVGGAFAIGQVAAFGKASLGAAEESAQATARLDQVFSSMGDTTGEASRAAQEYASQLSKKTAIDDELILAAQAQLATFGAVSDETARGAGVFDRATAAAADLAAAGFGTLDGNAVQLGKALQDPVKGLAALGKSGVTFTDAQKEQIAAMQESGDLLGAQQVVLEAVESQVKGTAEATVTESDKMALAYGEVQESIGSALMPALEALAPILETIAGFIEDNVSWILPLAGALGVFATAVYVANTATTLFNISLGIGVGWIALIAVAIAALVVGIIWAYNNVDWFRAAVDFLWQAIQTGFRAIVTAFGWLWDTAKKVFGWLKSNWPLLLAILTGPIGMAVLLITRNWDTIKAAATAVWQWVTDKFQAIADFFTGLVSTIGDTIGDIVDAIKSPINAVIRGWNRFRFPSATFDTGAAGILPGVPDSITIGGWDLPNISELAAGGIVRSPTLALVGESGPEAVVPLGRGFGPTYVITINAGVGTDPAALERAVVDALRRHERRNGTRVA